MRFKNDRQRRAMFAKLVLANCSELSSAQMSKFSFRSTKNIPYPSFVTRDQNDDLRAVIDGDKPAAMIPIQDSITKSLIGNAKNKGFAVEYVQDFDPVTGKFLSDSVIVGVPENVKRLKDLRNVSINNIDKEYYTREMGHALGIADDAIEDFVSRIPEMEKGIHVEDFSMVPEFSSGVSLGKFINDDDRLLHRKYEDIKGIDSGKMERSDYLLEYLPANAPMQYTDITATSSVPLSNDVLLEYAKQLPTVEVPINSISVVDEYADKPRDLVVVVDKKRLDKLDDIFKT